MTSVANRMIAILVLLMCIAIPLDLLADSAPKKQVAVYTTNTDVEDGIKKIVQAKIISILTQSGQYRVLERNADFLNAIQDDLTYGMSGNVRDSQIAAIGKQFGAQMVLVIDISEVFAEYFIAVRMVNVESGVITASAEILVEDPSTSRLVNAAEKVAREVVGQRSYSSNSTGANVSYATNNNVETFTVNGVSFDMIKVDGGSFQMGSTYGESDEQPVHSKTVSTFYIGKTEVTQQLWVAVMGTNPSQFKGETMPVENVSWFDCQEFVERLSRLTGRIFRLPTETEWEYAARGGNQSRCYSYSGSNDLYRVGWYCENSGGTTHPVAEKLDNELGIYDMSGNVWEWTSDNYSANYSSPRNSADRVIRGGGWGNNATGCRVAYRNYCTPSNRYNSLGLRLAL